MAAVTDSLAAEREARRRIVRRATYYTLGLIAMALVIAAAGSAIVAWFLTLSGLPFRATWLTLTLFVLLVPPLGMAVGALRRRWGKGQGAEGRDEA